MNQERPHNLACCLLALAAALVPCAAWGVQVNHLYNLANFTGVVPYNHVKLFVDQATDEVYVADRNQVRIFNSSGMEVYSFDADPKIGSIYDLAVDENGDLLILSWDLRRPSDRQFFITRCDYRGEPLERITISGLPPEYATIGPNVLLHREGRFFLVSKTQMLAVVTDKNGIFQAGYDLAALINVEGEERAKTKIAGFDMDDAGNLLFTVPVLFRGFVVSPDGKLIGSLGRPGSGPGSFGIAAGIAADSSGHYFVAEKLRGAVMLFDSNFQFVTEFGHTGNRAGNLIIPQQLVTGNDGKLYVTQLLDRGVSVFSVKPD